MFERKLVKINKYKISLLRKILSEIAVNDSSTFKKVVETAIG